MTRRLLIVLGVLATTFVVAARAQDDRLPVKINPRGKSDVKRSDDKTDPKIKIGDAATQQEHLKRQFDEFKLKLLRLAQTMENSTKQEDREKAKILRAALNKASAEGIETRFTTLIEMLSGRNAANNTEALQDILKENDELRRILRDIIELLTKDDRDLELKKEIERTRRLLEELKNVIRKQELVLNKTIIGRTKNQDLEKSQRNVREQTHDLVNPKSNQGKEAKKGEGKGNKSGQKGLGEGKDDTKDPKADAKDSKGSKSGEGKDAKSGEGKDAKSGEGKDGKSGEGKDGKSGEGKDGKGKDDKQSESKDGKGKESKNGESKTSKPGEAKSGKPGSGKSGESKPGAGKSGDSKGKGEGKADSKGGSGKSGQGKQGEGKPGQGGQSGQQGQQGEGKSGSGNKGGQQQQQQQPNQEQSQIKKQIEDAEKYQHRAEDNLRKDNRKDAPEDEQAALDKLNQAKKALEDLLRQLREEEIERLLARLEARCRRMLALQIGVRDDTVALDKVIKSNPNSAASRVDQQASLVLSDREEEIVKEARAGLALLEEEGSAVAFAEVFSQVKGDMETVAARLRKTDTGVVTVAIEDQIIDTLKEMIEALKKAQADSKKKSQGGGSGMPQPDRLLDLLAELKMIRSMQKRVNARTELYGKQYAGEQAPPPEQGSNNEERERYERIQTELKDLSKRQQKIGKVTHDIATGKNEQK
ncbi:MAG TPA: hypothetical protein VE999_17450 [Gemmataceae bacterium]|nr:hypothetical protein [Gemmataceae bacterium]